MPIWQTSAHESDRKTDFPTPCADNWRKVPENLLHDSWFLGLIRNSKRLQRGWVGGWWKDFFGNSYCQLWVTSLLLKNGWCFPLTTSPLRRASWECLRGLRPGTILGNWGARGALRTILESLQCGVSLHPTGHESKRHVGVFLDRSGTCWRESHVRMFWVLPKRITWRAEFLAKGGCSLHWMPRAEGEGLVTV